MNALKLSLPKLVCASSLIAIERLVLQEQLPLSDEKLEELYNKCFSVLPRVFVLQTLTVVQAATAVMVDCVKQFETKELTTATKKSFRVRADLLPSSFIHPGRGVSQLPR